APHSSLVHMFDTVRAGFGDSTSESAAGVFFGQVSADGSWVLDCAKILGRLREVVERGQPLTLLGTAFSFVHLLDFLLEQGVRIQLPPGWRAMETGGYKGRSRQLPGAELHRLLAEHLGLRADHIVREYGMSELSAQAYDTKVPDGEIAAGESARCFRFPPWSRARVISPEDGREVRDGAEGLLRIVDLANVFSGMAIQTEDLA